MQELIKHQGINAQDRFLAGEQALAHHVHKGFQFNACAGLGWFGLQKPELTVFNSEGDFLYGFEMALDLVQR